MSKETGVETHVATRSGQAKSGDAYFLVEEGNFIPAGNPIALDGEIENGWMKPVKGSERALMGAVSEALDPFDKDVDLTQLNVAALQALAAERGIDSGNLSKKDLIAAIKAAHDPTR